MINADQEASSNPPLPLTPTQQAEGKQRAYKLAVAKERLKWAQFRLNMFIFLFIVEAAPALISLLLRTIGLGVPQLHGYVTVPGTIIFWLVLLLYVGLIGFSVLARRAAAGQLARLQAAQEQQAHD